jgi:hypothetical protein
MPIQHEIDKQASAIAGESAQPGKDSQRVPKDRKDHGKPSPNLHSEHQDQHGSGEGLTGMQPGAGHPRGR